jgi:hypothetical protein
VYRSVATSSAIRHLDKHHHVVEKLSIEETNGLSVQPTIPSQFQCAPITHTAATLFKSDLMRLVVDGDLSFSIIRKPALRRLLTTANSTFTNALLPHDPQTIRKWIDVQYMHHVQAVRISLASRLSKVHVSFDIWTSPTTQAFLSIVVYFVDDTGQRHTRLLALQRLFGLHTGENQGAVLL